MVAISWLTSAWMFLWSKKDNERTWKSNACNYITFGYPKISDEAHHYWSMSFPASGLYIPASENWDSRHNGATWKNSSQRVSQWNPSKIIERHGNLEFVFQSDPNRAFLLPLQATWKSEPGNIREEKTKTSNINNGLSKTNFNCVKRTRGTLTNYSILFWDIPTRNHWNKAPPMI